MNGLALKILKGSFPPISPTYSKGLRDLINKMLNVNPKARPTIYDIVHKPFVKLKIIFYMLDVFTGNYLLIIFNRTILRYWWFICRHIMGISWKNRSFSSY